MFHLAEFFFRFLWCLSDRPRQVRFVRNLAVGFSPTQTSHDYFFELPLHEGAGCSSCGTLRRRTWKLPELSWSCGVSRDTIPESGNLGLQARQFRRLADPNFTRGMSDKDRAHDLSHLYVGGVPDPLGNEP